MKYPYELLNNITKRWIDICSPIYVKNPKEKTSAISIGTGFLVRYENRIFFITAYHVVKDIEKNDYIILNFHNQPLMMENVYFFIDKENDIAISYLSHDWLVNKDLKNIKAIDIMKDINTACLSDAALLLGYPSSKNKLSQKFDKKNRFGMGFGLYEKLEKTNSNTKLLNPIAFRFDPNNAYNEELEKIGLPPHLKGMSGSPILSYYAENDSLHIKINIIGIFLEWYPKNKEVIGSTFESIKLLLQSTYNKIINMETDNSKMVN